MKIDHTDSDAVGRLICFSRTKGSQPLDINFSFYNNNKTKIGSTLKHIYALKIAFIIMRNNER